MGEPKIDTYIKKLAIYQAETRPVTNKDQNNKSIQQKTENTPVS